MIGVSVADLAGRGDYVTDGTEYVVLESGQLATELRVSTLDVAVQVLMGSLSRRCSRVLGMIRRRRRWLMRMSMMGMKRRRC